MATETMELQLVNTQPFPYQQVKDRLMPELQEIADVNSVLRPEWDPLLDSLQVVGILLVLEPLFDFKIPPDKIVEKGGYETVDETVTHVIQGLHGLWTDHAHGKAGK